MTDTSVDKQRRILIVAGEASGDLHAANLIRAARENDPGLSFFGLTGPKMRAAGCETLLPYDEISVMGFVEVIGRLPAIRRAFKAVTVTFTSDARPDLLVLVDFPGFNMRLAKAAKDAGIPVLYYIAPKVWAWRQGRAKRLASSVDRMAVIFPFEPDFYAPYGLRADYVGNPLLDEFAEYNAGTAENGGTDEAETTIGLFPGSRRSEIDNNLPTLLTTARLLQDERSDLKFILPLAPSVDRLLIERMLAESGVEVQISERPVYAVAAACSAVLAVSGTVTLQVALAGTPLAVLYRSSPLSVAIARRVVKIPHISLVNIVAGREVVREFIQEQASPENLGAEILQILDNPEYNQKICSGLDAVRKLMGEPGCSQKVAKILTDMLESNHDR